MEEIQVDEGDAVFILPLPSYILLRKSNAKPVKDAKDVKYGKFTPLLPEDVLFEGDILGNIPQLKFTDNNFND